MKSFLKYPGGKQKEIGIIRDNLPSKIYDYYEPFIGGGSVYLALDFEKKYYINDLSEDLINLYNCIKNQNELFFKELDKINYNIKLAKEISVKEAYDFYENHQNYDEFLTYFLTNAKIDDLDNLKNKLYISLNRKLKLIDRLDKRNIEKIDIFKNIKTGITSGLYVYYRELYNNLKYDSKKELKAALFYYIRDFCYSSMFRYNSFGEFNVPYGGISYDNKNLDSKIEFLKNENVVSKLKKSKITNEDFEIFFRKNKPKKEDFIFLDPPYDTEFSTYDNNPFGLEDHIRLRDFCKNTEANFMLIIKETDFILELYKNFNIKKFKKNYTVSFKDRNKKDVNHLLITNY
ncbi:DNA adenine methylase [Streptobacillus moniliformis]|uniref:DNA adenine methylase n=1 Tax=Streptobacillus moniliformis TaxID=34105 RepID=UPI0007E49E16|nr:DNA adenine methylase [Streptobacillus moniliformis]